MTIIEKYNLSHKFDLLVEELLKQRYKYKSKCADFVFMFLNKLFNIEYNYINLNINTKNLSKGKDSFSLLNNVMKVLNKDFKYKLYNFTFKEYKKGDILLCGVKSINPNHIAIYYKDNKIINSFPNVGLLVENIDKCNILYIIRLVDWRKYI